MQTSVCGNRPPAFTNICSHERLTMPFELHHSKRIMQKFCIKMDTILYIGHFFFFISWKYWQTPAIFNTTVQCLMIQKQRKQIFHHHAFRKTSLTMCIWQLLVTFHKQTYVNLKLKLLSAQMIDKIEQGWALHPQRNSEIYCVAVWTRGVRGRIQRSKLLFEGAQRWFFFFFC